MYADILGTSSYLSVNKKLMKIFGTDTAVYLAVLLDIVRCVERKKKYEIIDNKPFFKVDRKYVTEQTSLTEESQAMCEVLLTKAGFYAVSETSRNLVSLNCGGIEQLIINDNETELDRLQKELSKTKRAKQRTKKDYAILALKKSVAEMESDSDVIAALENWVEAVYSTRKLTKAVIQQFQSELNAYTSSKDTKLKLVALAMSSGYAVFEWVKNSYERNGGRKAVGSRIPAKQEECAGLMEGVEF